MFQNIRRMEEKVKGGSTNKVIVTKPNGDVTEYNKKEDMEREYAKSNESKWYQTEGVSQQL